MEITISIDRIYVTLKGDADDLRELQLPDLPTLGPLLADALAKGDARVKVESAEGTSQPKPFVHRHGIPLIPEEPTPRIPIKVSPDFTGPIVATMPDAQREACEGFNRRHYVPVKPEDLKTAAQQVELQHADAEGCPIDSVVEVKPKPSHRANTCWAQGEDKLSNKARALRLVAAKRMTKDALQDEILDKDYSTTKGGAYALTYSLIRDGLAVLEDVEGGEPVLVLTEAGKQAALLPEDAR